MQPIDFTYFFETRFNGKLKTAEITFSFSLVSFAAIISSFLWSMGNYVLDGITQSFRSLRGIAQSLYMVRLSCCNGERELNSANYIPILLSAQNRIQTAEQFLDMAKTKPSNKHREKLNSVLRETLDWLRS